MSRRRPASEEAWISVGGILGVVLLAQPAATNNTTNNNNNNDNNNNNNTNHHDDRHQDNHNQEQPAQQAAAGDPYSQPTSMHSSKAKAYSKHLPLFRARTRAFRIVRAPPLEHPALVCASPCPVRFLLLKGDCGSRTVYVRIRKYIAQRNTTTSNQGQQTTPWGHAARSTPHL